MKKSGNEKGIALVIVLWALLAVSVLAIQACRAARTDVRSLDFDRGRTDAGNLALAALKEAKAEIPGMKSETFYSSRSLKDADGKEYASYSFMIVDESGRLDINNADEAEISTLVRLAGGSRAEALASRALQARDRYPGGAFTLPEELLNVDGFHEDFFYGEDADDDLSLDGAENDGSKTWPPDDGDGILEYGLRRHIRTACPGKMNINRATREALLSALGSTPDFVDAVIAASAAAGGKMSLSEIAAIPGIAPEMAGRIDAKLTDRSMCFRIMAEGRMEGSGAAEVITAYAVAGPDGKISFAGWREM